MTTGWSAGRGRLGSTALLLLAAATAWAWVAGHWRGMGAMPGTMGLRLPAFLPVWTVMTAAMMLPATVPVASLYGRTVLAHRFPRVAAFTVGYLLVWAAAGLPAYALAAVTGRAASTHAATATAVAAAVFAVNGVYQLTPFKDRCLARCRSPIGLMLRYTSHPGRARDVRAGAHHGAFCLGCCWSLMALLAAFGMMNVWAMVGLAAVLSAEKLTPAGPVVARVVGMVSIALAVAVVWVPELAPGLLSAAATRSG